MSLSTLGTALQTADGEGRLHRRSAHRMREGLGQAAGGKLSPYSILRQTAARLGEDGDSMSGASRILLVEDDSALAQEMLGALARQKWTVDHVACLTDAFEAVMQMDYRAILLDRRLPDGD